MTNTLRALLPNSVSWGFPSISIRKLLQADVWMGWECRHSSCGSIRSFGDPLERDCESSVKGDVNRKTSVPKVPGKSYSFTWEVTRRISLVCRSRGSEAEFDEMPVTAGGGSLGQALSCSVNQCWKVTASPAVWGCGGLLFGG